MTQVLCINDDWESDVPPPSPEPVKGQVYTVTGIHRKWDQDYYKLWEFPQNLIFFVGNFRQCRPTDISCFKTTVPKDERWIIRKKEKV